MPVEFGDDDLEAILAGDDDDVGYDEAAVEIGRKKRKAKSKMKVVPYGKQLYLLIGITSSSTIAAAATSNQSNRPQVPFKPVRFVIRAAASWDLTDIKVGNDSQFVAAGTVPGDLFLNTAVDALLDCATVQSTQDLIMSVTNNTGGALTFSAAVLGPAALT